MKIFIFLAFLTACGTDNSIEQTINDATKQETAETVPDFRNWQVLCLWNGEREGEACLNECFQVSKDKMSCVSEFTMDERSCSMATLKYVVKRQGYMYVQTVQNVILRQGEFHRIEFEGQPEVYNIQDKTVDIEAVQVMCFGPNGEVVRI